MRNHRLCTNFPYLTKKPRCKVRILIKCKLHQNIMALIDRHYLSICHLPWQILCRKCLHPRKKPDWNLLFLNRPCGLIKRIHIMLSKCIIIQSRNIKMRCCHNFCYSAHSSHAISIVSKISTAPSSIPGRICVCISIILPLSTLKIHCHFCSFLFRKLCHPGIHHTVYPSAHI